MTTYDINVENQLGQLLTLISDIQNQEIDIYIKALLKRINQNVEATKCLLESAFLLDSCALIRISVDHCCRLYQYTNDPASIPTGRHQSALKLLGNGPGTAYTFEALGAKAEFGLLYGVLCAFVHPDLMSLILSLSEDEKDKIVLKVIISMGLILSTYILLEIYKEFKTEDCQKDILNKAKSVMDIFISAIITSATPEKILAMSQIPNINQLFAKQEINKHLQEFMDIASDGPDAIEALLRSFPDYL